MRVVATSASTLLIAMQPYGADAMDQGLLSRDKVQKVCGVVAVVRWHGVG